MSGILLAAALVAIAYCFFHSPLCCSAAGLNRAQDREAAPEPDSMERATEVLERLTEETGALRADIDELAERLDFTERTLTAMHRREAISGSAAEA